jgi:hypothetical protein
VPGNGLNINYLYSIANDLNCIAERTSNTRMGFVSLFERHDMPWINGSFRIINIQLDQSLMSCNMSHIGVTDTSSITKEDYTMHGLHLIYRGKKSYTQLIAERVGGGHAQAISSSPVI